MSDKGTRDMSEQNDSRPTPLGLYARAENKSITSIEVIALALSAIWLIGAAVFFLTLPSAPQSEDGTGSLRFIMTMLAIFMPVGMIWVAATAARSSRIIREESQRLQAAIDAIRNAYIVQSQGGNAGGQPSQDRDSLGDVLLVTRKPQRARTNTACH